jgi:hypothetical protein
VVIDQTSPRLHAKRKKLERNVSCPISSWSRSIKSTRGVIGGWGPCPGGLTSSTGDVESIEQTRVRAVFSNTNVRRFVVTFGRQTYFGLQLVLIVAFLRGISRALDLLASQLLARGACSFARSQRWGRRQAANYRRSCWATTRCWNLDTCIFGVRAGQHLSDCEALHTQSSRAPAWRHLHLFGQHPRARRRRLCNGARFVGPLCTAALDHGTRRSLPENVRRRLRIRTTPPHAPTSDGLSSSASSGSRTSFTPAPEQHPPTVCASWTELASPTCASPVRPTPTRRCWSAARGTR